MLYLDRGNPPKHSGSRYSEKMLDASYMLVKSKDSSSKKPYFLRPIAIMELSCGQTVPLWYPSGLYRRSNDDSVRMPQPLNMSSSNIRRATSFAFSGSTISLQSACPAFDEITSHWPSLSSASAKYFL